MFFPPNFPTPLLEPICGVEFDDGCNSLGRSKAVNVGRRALSRRPARSGSDGAYVVRRSFGSSLVNGRREELR